MRGAAAATLNPHILERTTVLLLLAAPTLLRKIGQRVTGAEVGRGGGQTGEERRRQTSAGAREDFVKE
jgi:hypothetical protein